jgi:hypothetical protein
MTPSLVVCFPVLSCPLVIPLSLLLLFSYSSLSPLSCAFSPLSHSSSCFLLFRFLFASLLFLISLPLLSAKSQKVGNGKHTNRIILEHTQGSVLTRAHQSLVVAGQCHGDEAHGDGAGLCCFGVSHPVLWMYWNLRGRG